MNTDQQNNSWGQIVLKAWQDQPFKKRLMANPAAVLKEQGLEPPAGLQVCIVEDTNELIHLTLPAKPREGELADDELENVAGGFGPRLAAIAAAKWAQENCRTWVETTESGRQVEDTICKEPK